MIEIWDQLYDAFATITDPGVDRTKAHSLVDIISIAICAVICGADSWVAVETFGTGDAKEAAEFVRSFDFRPGSIISSLGLDRPMYRQTTNYGHFGRPGLPWEM